ncbi:helix-turn-helix domain-containing protein [Kribbella italica]|uniref:Transcriptional regulator with XRE-family HTH domain n=1 Tax=Kribbella italica TaxID=1540520 RepID=A0A7W9JF63_9ACTN|nr:helix-turn-helix domain-containing protein [Kribbella italica]MBB5840834.1 transcriptional regulator with XRE-family HTH domain [Kribbella italica]
MPDDFWQDSALLAAAAERHFGQLLLSYRKLQRPEPTQALVGQWLGLTQGQVSRIERSKTPVHDLDKLDRWAHALQIPPRLLWFTLSHKASDACNDIEKVSNLERSYPPDHEGPDVRRRDLFKTAGAVVAASSSWLSDTPWQRLSDSVLRGRVVDRTTVQLVEDRTAEFYTAEETRPARDILRDLQKHRQMLDSLLANTQQSNLRDRLLVAMGESDALLGWMHFDLGSAEPAVNAWRRALQLANQTGDGALAACALGYWSYLAAGRGDSRSAVGMLERAESAVSGMNAPATRSWIAIRLAEETARSGESTTSLRALDRAMTAFDFASPRTERPWTGFFTASRLGSSTVATYTRLNHSEADAAANSLLGSLSLGDNKVRGLVLAELATAAAHARDFEKAGDLSQSAIRIVTRTEANFARKKLEDLASSLPAGTTPALRLRRQITAGLSASRS